MFRTFVWSWSPDNHDIVENMLPRNLHFNTWKYKVMIIHCNEPELLHLLCQKFKFFLLHINLIPFLPTTALMHQVFVEIILMYRRQLFSDKILVLFSVDCYVFQSQRIPLSFFKARRWKADYWDLFWTETLITKHMISLKIEQW